MEINNDYIIHQRGMNYSLLPYSRTMHHMVRLRVTYNGKRIDIRTGIRVEPRFWDKKTQRVKRGFRYQEETDVTINAALISYVRFVNLYFIECERNFRAPVLTDLRDKFNYLYKHTGKLKKTEFFYLFEEFIKIKSGEKGWGKDMVDVYERLLEKIRKFKADIRFTDLDTQTLEAFKESLAETMYNDAIKKNLSYLKSFIKWAKSKHYSVCEDFETYDPKLPKAHISVKYLTLDELDRIYNLKIEEGSALDQTRDAFIFQCYTALRYSDIKQLRPRNILRGKDGYIIRLLTEKDDDAIEFPLAKRAVAIYKKYSGRIYDEGRLFPILSNQKYNEHLKELGRAADLKGE
ncbi:MAG: phage integrase SAM-like domain-containing protein [Prevotella sp.]|nr:phage integrase SAM-like domain-containing protein [Prevotella sp.]